MTYPGAHGKIEETVSLYPALKLLLFPLHSPLPKEGAGGRGNSHPQGIRGFKLHCIFINLELKIYVC